MAEYTPTTAEVRAAFSQHLPSRSAAFSRWLAAHDREVAAEALRDAADWLDAAQTRTGGYPRDIPLTLHKRADRIERGA